jgi:hypothetical protein
METLAHLQALAHASQVRKLVSDAGLVVWEKKHS